jgi:hypothetical protein
VKPSLTDEQRVEVRMQLGRVSAIELAEKYGVSDRTIRRAWYPDSKDARARNNHRRRTSYHHSNPRSVRTFRLDYRAQGLGEGRAARCSVCKRKFTNMDFDTDIVTGQVLEPCTCWRCAA